MFKILRITACLLLFYVTSYAQSGVGIDVANPQEMLDVNGAVKIGTDFTNTNAAPAGGAGTIRWNGTSFQGWDGTQWITFEGASNAANVLEDADQDTKVQVEESPDEDIIRLDVAGTERLRISGHQIEPVNNGNSVFIGKDAGENDDLLGDNRNVAIGKGALAANVNSADNTAIGGLALTNATGENNVSIGAFSSHLQTGGNLNTIIGSHAGEGTGPHSKNRNVLLGHSAGGYAHGSANVMLGYAAGQYESGGNKLYIENSNSSSPLIYGEFNNNLIGINGRLGVGTQSPQDELHVAGSIRMIDGNQAIGFVPVSDANGTMVWTNPATVSTASVDEMIDADNDTRIQVEESADEDIIRFDLAGTERFVMDGPRLEVNNSGRSVFIGNGAGTNDDLTNNEVVYIGGNAGTAATSAENNTAVGYDALSQNLIGSSNTAIGNLALSSNTNSFNTAVGFQALENDATGTQNTAVGQGAMSAHLSGNYNVVLGQRAFGKNTSGANNVAVGRQAGFNNINGDGNVFLGRQAGYDETGSDKLYIENSNSSAPLIYGEFNTNTLGFNANVGVGTQSPQDELHVEGSVRMVDGNQSAGFIPVSDANGTMVWTDPTGISGSLDEIVDADNDTKIQVEESADEDLIRFDISGTEYFRMHRGRIQVSNADGSVMIGEDAGLNDSRTNGSIFLGYQAGYSNTVGDHNVAIGRGALQDNISGPNNIAIGFAASANSTGSNNVAIGFGSLVGNVSGILNVAIGTQAGRTSMGSANVYVGVNAGLGTASTTSSDNVMIGRSAGENNNGSGNVFFGNRAGFNESGSNKLYIENSNSSTPLIYGEFDNDILGFNANVGIGTQDPQDELHVEGSIRMVDGNQAAGFIPVSDANGTMVWTDAATLVDTLNLIQDADRDTKIQVEETADEDRIRFDLAGIEKWLMTGSSIVPQNSGLSIFIGQNAGASDDLTDNQNVFVGYLAGRANTSGANNIALGRSALGTNLDGSGNTAIGYLSQEQRTTGSSNISLGSNSLRENLDGGSNIAIGSGAIANNASGSDNVAIGGGTGQNNISGSDNIFLGRQAGFNETGSNKLYIENSSSATPLIYGEFNTNTLGFNAKVGIGNQNPQDELHVEGSIRMVDGNQAAGFVPVSDANGTMVWTNPATISTIAPFEVNSNVVRSNATLVTTTTDDFVFGSLQLDYDNSASWGKFFFDKSKGAFRAGSVNDVTWDETELGIQSFAGGFNTTASGARATAFGQRSIASGDNSFAVGGTAVASGDKSFASGNNTTASGLHSTAMGSNSTSSGIASISIGEGTTSSGSYSASIGNSATASGDFAFASGRVTTASGRYSTAMGYFTTAISAHETVLGAFNTDYTPISTTVWNPADRLFVVGNGTSGVATSDALTILKNGNVGIGVSDPQDELHVEGSIRMVDGNEAAGFIPVSDGNGTMVWTNPVSAGMNLGANSIQFTDVENSNATIELRGSDSSYPDKGVTLRTLSNPANGEAIFRVLSSGGAERLRVEHNGYTRVTNGFTATGNVGVGVTDPLDELHVDGSIRMVDGNEQAGYLAVSDANGTMTWTAPSGVGTDGDWVVAGNDQYSAVSGNVGINTTSPTSRLAVAGSTDTEGAVNIDEYEIKLLNSGQAHWSIFNEAASGKFHIAETSNLGAMGTGSISSYGLTIDDANGNYVGIGTDSPEYQLEVSGNASGDGTTDYVAYFRNNDSNASNSTKYNGVKIKAGKNANNNADSRMIQFVRPDGTDMGEIAQSNSNSVSYNTTSDIRLKTNITPTHFGLNDLMQIDVMDYVYKDEPTAPTTGFIAQQLYEHYPEAVSVGGDDAKTNPWMLDYGKLTPLLVKAVQELTETVRAQQQEIESLKQSIENR